MFIFDLKKVVNLKNVIENKLKKFERMQKVKWCQRTKTVQGKDNLAKEEKRINLGEIREQIIYKLDKVFYDVFHMFLKSKIYEHRGSFVFRMIKNTKKVYLFLK